MLAAKLTLARPFGLLPPAAARGAASPFESPLVLWLLVAVAAFEALHPSGISDIVLGLKLPDNDDAMRLAGVRDLVAGQAWFDPVQHRHLPPAGVATHWSRLVDAPIAGLVLAFSFLGPRLAEGVAAALWPALLFVLVNALLFVGTRRTFGLRAACLALFAASQTASILGLFAYGRIDHHNVQACAILGVGLCLFERDSGWRRAALAGALCAFSLAVGLETLPFIAVAGLVLAVDWIREGQGARHPLLAFALALLTASLAFFAAQTAPERWGIAACDALSAPWLALAGIGALAAAALVLARPATAGGRIILAAGIGAVAAGAFVLAYPACALSPFGDLPPLVRDEWLTKVNEMKSFWAHLRAGPAGALASVAPLWIAAIAASWLAWHERGPRARALAVAAAFLWPGVLITNFQIRGIYVAGVFVPVVAGIVFDHALSALREAGVAPWRRAALVALAVSTLGKSWAFALGVPPLLLNGTNANAQPDPSSVAWRACTDPARLAALDALRSATILAPIDLGPNLLLHTRHAIVAAPYHRAVAGLMAGLEAFAGDEAVLRRHVAVTGADLVLLCDAWLDPKEAFASRLARGEAEAGWLERVGPTEGPLKAWRVRPWELRPGG